MQSPDKTVAARAGRCIGLFGSLAAMACGGQTSSGAASTAVESGDSGTGGTTVALGAGGHVGPSGLTGSGGILFGGTGGSAAGSADASVVPVIVDAGPQPIVSCGTASDASGDLLDGAACAPPPGHCADNRTLVYYTDGRCAEGSCVWTMQLLTCRTSCSDGGCQSNFTRTR